MPTDKLTDKSFESLAKALRCWLDFQIHCGREQLLSEAFLTQPIGEFLMAHYSGFLKPEQNHPQFERAIKGRPKQVDYVLESREKKLLDFAVECKWAGQSLPTRQSIVDDIMRLECLRRPPTTKGTSLRYFIFTGKKKAIGGFLQGRINNTGLNPPPNFLSGYLPLVVAPRLTKVAVNTCQIYHRSHFADFSKGYELELPNSYRARLVADETGDDVRVLIWKIASMGRRTTFKYETIWSL